MTCLDALRHSRVDLVDVMLWRYALDGSGIFGDLPPNILRGTGFQDAILSVRVVAIHVLTSLQFDL